MSETPEDIQQQEHRQRFWLRVKRATLVGIVASIAIHLVVGLIAAILTVDYSNADAGGAGGPEVVDFAVMSEAELSKMTDDAANVSATHAPDLAPSSLEEVQLTSDDAGGEIDDLMQELVEVDVSSGGGDISSGSLDDAAAGGGGLSGDGASFFGVEAQGNRFAYIVDVSSSMRVEGRMDRTKKELIRSISSLSSSAEVVIVLYSNGPVPLTGKMAWTRLDKRNKIRLRRDIMDVAPGGGTRPMGAFEAVFEIDPNPDAIYFMTDGEFDDEVVGAVRSMNRKPKVPVHCIMFGQIGNAAVRAQVEGRMREIARESGGLFKHVGSGP